MTMGLQPKTVRTRASSWARLVFPFPCKTMHPVATYMAALTFAADKHKLARLMLCQDAADTMQCPEADARCAHAHVHVHVHRVEAT